MFTTKQYVFSEVLEVFGDNCVALFGENKLMLDTCAI